MCVCVCLCLCVCVCVCLSVFWDYYIALFCAPVLGIVGVQNKVVMYTLQMFCYEALHNPMIKISVI